MDEKLELILRQNMPASELDATEVKRIKEELLSTEKCLQICARLSEHISQVQITAQRCASTSASGDSNSIPEKITNEGLQECKESLARMARELASHEKQLFDRLMSKLDTASAFQETAGNIVRLREEWESTRKSMDILSKAGNHLEKSISTIENHATGDAVQIMVSANGKTLHCTNRGLGWEQGKLAATLTMRRSGRYREIWLATPSGMLMIGSRLHELGLRLSQTIREGMSDIHSLWNGTEKDSNSRPSLRPIYLHHPRVSERFEDASACIEAVYSICLISLLQIANFGVDITRWTGLFYTWLNRRRSARAFRSQGVE